MHEAMIPEMTRCIGDCHERNVTYLSKAMNHRLEMGGKHTEPAHFKLMMDLARICRACAASCEQLNGMEACVVACCKYAENCEKIMGEIVRPDGVSCAARII